MTISQVKFACKLPVFAFANETIEVTIDVSVGEDANEAINIARKLCFENHKFNNQHLFAEESSPIVNNKVENVDKELQRLDLLIEDCSTLDELKSYQFVVKGESKKKYDEKFKLLSNGTAK